jgi:hypothetical protein
VVGQYNDAIEMDMRAVSGKMWAGIMGLLQAYWIKLVRRGCSMAMKTITSRAESESVIVDEVTWIDNLKGWQILRESWLLD